MNDNPDHPPSDPSPRPPHPSRRTRTEVPPEIHAEILRLHQFYGTRQIAQRVALSRKIVRRILSEHGSLPAPRRPQASSKLDPFRASIQTKVASGLTTTRILREIRELGYSGGRSILAQYAQSLRASLSPTKSTKAKRRFETPLGREMQIDWSPYRVQIDGVTRIVYAFGCLLAASRKLWVHFYRNERQSTLLEALASAFEYFLGSALRVVLDNMATAVLGRWGPNGEPVWHPRFLDFARHYGFEPFACAVADPDRKGKKEKSFRLLWDDFLKGSTFASLEELNARTLLWLDQTPGVGNQRVHGTTRVVPNHAWLSERELLIQLPDKRFPVFEQSVRLVDQDCTISVEGTSYTIPSSLACRSVALHLFAEHFEVLDSHHRLLYSRRYAPEADKGKLIIDPTHYATLPGRQGHSAHTGRLDQAFLKRFPSLAPFVHGLQLRMKNLAPVYLRALLRLAESYGEEAFLSAVGRAQQYRRFDTRAVQRILEGHWPLPDEPSVAPLGGLGSMLIAEVPAGSLDDYGSLDTDARPAQTTTDTQEEPHGP
jgi:transposase